MISQTLLDKLQQLRLPAFRDGLREQLSNPQYAELSFEERLLLLVDMECTRRLNHRAQYRVKLANFSMHASIEDLDFSADRGLDRWFILELSQCNWIEKALNIIISGTTGTSKSFLTCAFGTAAYRLLSYGQVLVHPGTCPPGWLLSQFLTIYLQIRRSYFQ